MFRSNFEFLEKLQQLGANTFMLASGVLLTMLICWVMRPSRFTSASTCVDNPNRALASRIIRSQAIVSCSRLVQMYYRILSN